MSAGGHIWLSTGLRAPRPAGRGDANEHWLRDAFIRDKCRQTGTSVATNRRREREFCPVLTIEFDEVGAAPLAGLDTDPLPDEAFEWTGVVAEAFEVVSAVLPLADACCEAFWHTERRTAVRRLLHDAAAQNRFPILRRGSQQGAAAALCWLVDRANAAGGRLAVPLLLSHFGLDALPGSLANMIRVAIGARRLGGVDAFGTAGGLGSARYLTAAQRRHLIAVAAGQVEPDIDLSEACADLLDPGLTRAGVSARRIDDSAEGRLF